MDDQESHPIQKSEAATESGAAAGADVVGRDKWSLTEEVAIEVASEECELHK